MCPRNSTITIPLDSYKPKESIPHWPVAKFEVLFFQNFNGSRILSLSNFTVFQPEWVLKNTSQTWDKVEKSLLIYSGLSYDCLGYSIMTRLCCLSNCQPTPSDASSHTSIPMGRSWTSPRTRMETELVRRITATYKMLMLRYRSTTTQFEELQTMTAL